MKEGMGQPSQRPFKAWNLGVETKIFSFQHTAIRLLFRNL